MFCLEVIAHGPEAAQAVPTPGVCRPDPGGVLSQAQAPESPSPGLGGISQLVQPIWTDDLRPAQLLREPFCRECAAQYPPGDPRHRTRATVVDHIKPHRGSWPLFIDPANHQSLCKRCHDQKTAREQAEERRKRNRI